VSVNVITVAREFGSGGRDVARILADRLEWRLLDNELLKEIARAARVDPAVAEQYDENVDPWFGGLVRSIWHGSDEWPGGVSESDLLDCRTMANLARHVIGEVSRQGHCVVVGRGGQCILQNNPDAFHVFVYGPMELRKRRVRERLGAQPDPEHYIREQDRRRATYIQRYFGVEWCNPHLYDLLVSTRNGDEAAAGAVLQAAGLVPVHTP
jgi:cytidylate kinase